MLRRAFPFQEPTGMTTQATASQTPDPQDEQAASIAQQVQEAQADVANAETTAAATAQPAGESRQETEFVTRKDLEQLLTDLNNKAQGRAQQWHGQQTKKALEELRQQTLGQLEETLAPYRQLISDFEQQRVAQLEPDAQIEYWRQKAQKPAPVAQPKQETAAQTQESSVLTNEEQIALAASVRGFARAQGVNVNFSDPRVWEGWSADQSVAELEALAFRNIQKIKGPAKPAAPNGNRPAATVPSTRSAPKRPTAEYNSRQELMEALAAGQINSDQYREATKKLGR